MNYTNTPYFGKQWKKFKPNKVIEKKSQWYPILEFEEKEVLLCRSEWPHVEEQQYLKGCKWSPDGTCLLIAVRSVGMHILELPADLYAIDKLDLKREMTSWEPVISVPESGLIYDFNWYPGMTSANSSTCCWASTLHLGPIQLWDAFTGELRCSYKGYNDKDEIETAYSVAFSVDGQKIFAGFKKAVKIFETHKPGRECAVYPVDQTVSTIAISQARPGLVALELITQDGNSFTEVDRLMGHRGGITNLFFSNDGNRLYSGARQDNELICWDLRKTNKSLFSVGRFSNTSQRIYYDVSKCGKWLVSGGTDGSVQVWDVSTSDKPKNHYELKLHEDCCNGISLHPYKPIMATSSGQHHTTDPMMDATTRKEVKIENSVCLWWMGKRFSQNV